MHGGLVVSPVDGRPMYQQIQEQIRERVALGDWPPGYELPSIRQLAIDLRVSVITVKRAYLELEREGVIVTQQGKGSQVAAQAGLGARLLAGDLERALDQVAHLGAQLGLSPAELQNRLEEACSRRQTAQRKEQE
ncbi:MAG TPA: GntR family transcriptional regulator [Thermoanaerobaculia bacterium]|nr:GntR family transcriptional regulator [Thermoanaerobaculia bacterium]